MAVKIEMALSGSASTTSSSDHFKFQVVLAGKARFVEDNSVYPVGERAGEPDHGRIFGSEDHVIVVAVQVDAEVVGILIGGGLELRDAFEDCEFVDGQVLDLDVRLDLEAFGQERHDHCGELFVADLGRHAGVRREDLRFQVEASRFHRAGYAGDHVFADVIGALQQLFEGYVGGRETVCSMVMSELPDSELF